ncbi:unnamed protein product [Mytilus coruscus]|uniref:Peptidase A2 domain-containing protein n=1 Tax=Mytilus coruscus TaxID=42192 RepID=A0A6J8BYB5_MYTCO|nr:unnamed protein product [Mytilus coruscus]
MNINNEQMRAISQQLQQSEDRVDHKASVRPMDKLTTTEEGDTVQFKSAFEQQGTFQQMASVVSELVDKRNKEVKIPAMDTSSKSKFDLNQYNASTPKIHNKLPALGLSPISSHEPSTAPTLLKANLVSSPKAGCPMSGQPPFKNILETSSTDQGYQQMAYVSSYAHLPPTMSQSYLVQSSTPLQKQLAASGSYQVSPMPTNSIIPVESMANPPPPIFMTPIMTTSSAPGALTGLPQQQADSTDRSRKGQRKPKERGNSSSSDSSLEREYTRWQENSGARDRSQSPQLPKMQIFNGRGSITLEAFIYQFERTTGRRQWETGKRIQSKSKCNPNNGVLKQQRVGSVGQHSTHKSIGHETSPHDKTEQRPTSSSDIVIRRTIGKSLAVRGTIYDQNVSMIVDTAAMITLVNEKLIPADNEDSETVTLRGLGEQLVTGKIIKNTSLDIDRVNIQWDVCKAPLTDDVILGLNILDTLGAVINLSTEYSHTYHQQQSDKCGIC